MQRLLLTTLIFFFNLLVGYNRLGVRVSLFVGLCAPH